MPSPLDKTDELYRRDPRFRALVDMLRQQIETLELTPGEIREAAMYACMLVESRRPLRAVYQRPQEGLLTPDAIEAALARGAKDAEDLDKQLEGVMPNSPRFK